MTAGHEIIPHHGSAGALSGTIAEKLRTAVSHPQVHRRVLSNISKLTPDEWLWEDLFKHSQCALGKTHPYFNTLTFLNWWAQALQPKTYLEVGVRRGRSLSQVTIESPKTTAYCFDYWITNYGSNGATGMVAENPGPEFVGAELKRLGCSNQILFIKGDSHQTLPVFYRTTSRPQTIDLINVDGDHDPYGAMLDLEICLNMLSPGGALVFDDICHVDHPGLKQLWDDYKKNHPELLFIEDLSGVGTGLILKPPFDALEYCLLNSPLPSDEESRLRILMVYSRHPVYGGITLPQWIRDALFCFYSREVEVFSAGPGNQYDIPDSPNFYNRIGDLVTDLRIDLLLDIEGGAASEGFAFKRFPKNISIPKYFWAIDTHQYLPLQCEKAKHFDRVFSAQKNAVSALGPHAEWLPAGASLYEHDFRIERDIDVGFIGNIVPGLHNRRAAIIDRLKQEIPSFVHAQDLFLADKAQLTSRMKIMVNASLRNDINFRVFETLSCGALLITDRIQDNGFEDIFRDGEHLVTYETENELIEKIRYYLSHPEERERIARAGQELVRSRFLHRHAISRLLEVYHQQVASPDYSPPPNSTSSVERHTCWCGGGLSESTHPLYASCRDCGTQVLRKQFTPEELKAFYSVDKYWHERQVQVFNFPPIEERAENDLKDRVPVWYQVLEKVKPAPEHLLEIGCAHGGFLHYCRQRGAKNVVGVEVDEGTCEFARKRFNLPHVMAGLFPDVRLPYERFDAITGFDVIEHFLDPLSGLQAVANHLKDDGICFFQTPWYRGEGKDWNQFKPAEHTFLYSERGVKELFRRAGLEVVALFQGYFPDDMFVVGRKILSSTRQETDTSSTISVGTSPRKILFVRADSIGDNVMASGMLPHLAQKFQSSEIAVLCQEHVQDLYAACPYVSRTLGFNWGNLLRDENYRSSIARSIAEYGADVVLNSVYSRDPVIEFLVAQSSAAQKVCFRGDLSNISAAESSQTAQLYTNVIESAPNAEPEISRHRQFLSALGIANAQVEPMVWLTSDDEVAANIILNHPNLVGKKIIALFPSSQYAIKDYPNFASALLRCGVENEPYALLALGSEKDRTPCQQLLNALAMPSLNVCGETSLRVAAAIMKRCHLALGSDTAHAHLACAVGTPHVVVVGGGHFGRFLPYSALTTLAVLPLECFGCNWQCRHSRAHCITDLSPLVVQAAVQATLHGPSTRPRIFAESRERWEKRGLGPAWKDPLSMFKNVDCDLHLI